MLSILIRTSFSKSCCRFSMYNSDLCVLSSAAFAGAAWPFLSTPHDMGRTAAPLGHASDGPSSALTRTVHESAPARSYKPPTPGISKLSHRRPRQTKSYTFPHKKFKTTMDRISRSRSVTDDFSAEKSFTMSLSPGGSLKWDRKPVCLSIHRCMRCKFHSTRRSVR